MIQIRRRTAIVAVVAFVLVAGVAVTALVRTADAGGTFTDTPPWIEAHADWLAANNIANGYPDGTFRPNQSITRGQSAFWLGNYNDSLEIVSTPFTANVPGLRGLTRQATCPVGKRAIAGGTHSSDPFNGFFLLESGRSDDRTWTVSWENPNSGTYGSGTVEVLCAPDTISGP